MDQSTYAAVPYSGTYQPQQTAGHVLCCLCGTSIRPNPTNMCVNCIRSQVDITEGIQKQVAILWCKSCGRYLQPPKHWVAADPESKELLTFCIKRIRGMQKVKLVDAGFIWTEPHSMRLKVKLTVQGEVLQGAILQQTFVVDFVVERHMCPACNRQNANPNSWVACVQVRQHVAHKRTFFFLEQLILKHGADESCVNVKEIHEGIDFYFSSKAHALKFVDFLQSVVPTRHRADKQLVSHDIHTSTYNYKYTFSVEIAPVCKDDLVCLPAKVASSYGGISPLVLCTRVTNAVTVTDPLTLRSAAIEAPAYWRYPFRHLMTSRQLVEFIVLDVEVPDSSKGQAGYNHNGRWSLAECTVAKLSDFGSNDRVYSVRTHLGHLLHPGDHVLGYDTGNANLVSDELDAILQKGRALPEIFLVRKSYEEKRRRRRAKGSQRNWKLRRMAVEYAADDEAGHAGQAGHRANRGQSSQDVEAADMERFLEELEEDPDMRARVALYKSSLDTKEGIQTGGLRHDSLPADGDEEEESDEDDALSIPLEELLDDLAAMQIEEDEDEGEADHASKPTGLEGNSMQD